jgi:hypothetical protein
MDTASVKTTRQDEVKEAQPGQPAQEAPAGMSRINVPGMVQPRGEAPKPPDQGDTQAPPAPPSPPEERLEVR